jgi:uncharacterized membrane protein
MRLAWARERFWLIPLACTVVAIGLGLSFIALDQLIRGSIQLPFLISSGVDGARAMLSAIAGSMITFTGLVFSITIVTLQLASGQFSPRVLRTFLQDRFNQLTLGIFVAPDLTPSDVGLRPSPAWDPGGRSPRPD